MLPAMEAAAMVTLGMARRMKQREGCLYRLSTRCLHRFGRLDRSILRLKRYKEHINLHSHLSRAKEDALQGNKEAKPNDRRIKVEVGGGPFFAVLGEQVILVAPAIDRGLLRITVGARIASTW
jgi:hypothetical protein